MTRSDATDRFLAALSGLAPVAVWAHGSLGGDDYQVVEDVRLRRYGGPGSGAAPDEEWTARRARLTREYLGPAIDALVRDHT